MSLDGIDDPESIADLAREALAKGDEERAIPLVLAAARKHSDPLLWQWAGLLQRSLDEHGAALDSFATAARLAPADAKIAQGHAQVALEAGLPAVTLFERACALARGTPEPLTGLIAARMAAGQAQRAVAELEAILDKAPLWLDGHRQMAQLRSLIGDPGAASESLGRAIAKHPREPSLWLALCDLHLRREAFAQLPDAIARAIAAGAPAAAFDVYRAVAAGELADRHADQLLSEAAIAANPELALWRVRHLMRSSRADQALPLIDRELESPRSSAIWPYAAAAWRLSCDPRSRWLEDQPGLVSVVDLDGELAPLAPLATHLRSLHERSGQYLDQSVRGGSQTDGPLLSRIEPEIRGLRGIIVRAVEKYVAQLPPADPGHPTLAPRRDRRMRFSGSWSVRLRGGGHHSNHVHPQAWISSALYVALPGRREDEPADSGWLVLGEPQAEICAGLAPHTSVEPKPGRLVLFPSWTWHGTRPFADGERLTVAFDVASPR